MLTFVALIRRRMKRLIHRTTFLLLFLFPAGLFAQSIKDVRINEILVYNTNSLHDDYGRAVSWIELANRGYNKVNVAGCYLKANGKEYRIPRNDPRTLIPTRGFIVFYAAGDVGKGVFHTNLTLEGADCIEFYDQYNVLIDTFSFDPNEMIENVSYGWMLDDDGVERKMNLPATTPGSSNNTVERISQAEMFRQADPVGIILTITTTIMVAIVLTMLFYIFKILSYYYARPIKIRRVTRKKAGTVAEGELTEEVTVGAITGEELAALAVALYKYSEELHDTESNILTINQVKRMYSPWNSKIQSLRRVPEKR